jgi:hypothetical protein
LYHTFAGISIDIKLKAKAVFYHTILLPKILFQFLFGWGGTGVLGVASATLPPASRPPLQGGSGLVLPLAGGVRGGRLIRLPSGWDPDKQYCTYNVYTVFDKKIKIVVVSLQQI